MPYPMTESGVKDCELLFLMSPTISCAERSGRACRRQAVSPAIIGAENEVPSFHAVFPSGVIVAAVAPIPMISGLMRPSAVNPLPEKYAGFRLGETAPTVRTPSTSPGTVIFPQLLPPSFPALTTMSNPFCTPIAAAWEIKADLPSS